jgi:polar amino acid transport system substrate-binding protein
MKQLTQQLKSGKMEIIEVPFPTLGENYILVRNHFSVISAGTEGKTVADARKGYIAKARSRQKEVKQVIEMIKTNGLKSTYDFVMNKLDAPSALGYSCAGEIIAVGEKVVNFKVGDFVACAGNSASHADVVAVPVNLAVKIPENCDLKQAAFTTLGAIASQGIRQAELKFGENCLIIGMGLIGQLTAKIAQAAGINVIAVDISEASILQAKKNGIKNTFNRNQSGIEDFVMQFSGGFGVDSVIITAGTSSLDPINFAGELARKKGKVVIVGAVPTGFERKNYYKKELDLRMSMSYGPGRGDLTYEEKGIDYPIAFARWTENRNMQAFVDLIATKKIDISSLISHTFPLENADKAYDLIINKREDFNGILIRYSDDIPEKSIKFKSQNNTNSKGNIALIGAGNFAQGILLPKMHKLFSFGGILTSRGNMAKYIGEKYNFNYATNDENELFADFNIDTVFITTRHDSHAKFVKEGIKANKNIFVEKPLVLLESDLREIKILVETSGFSSHLIVGFNRRFAPAIQEMKSKFILNQVRSIVMRVNAGNLPKDHWVNDPEIGGGRIIGEACHFIDLAMFLADSKIKSVSAESLDISDGLMNSVVISLAFENGSIASISYLSTGNKLLNKEWIEVFCGGTVYQIDDFRSLKIFGKSEKTIKYKTQDKGHQTEITRFHDSIVNKKESIIPFEEIFLSSLATFKVLESIRENRKIFL